MQALQDTAMDDYSAACSGSENNAKNHAGTGSGSNDGFGEGNFKALFESLELDQMRRGVIPAKA
jgi:hypothetical protein